MSAEEFWHGPFDLARAYRKAWRIRREVERDEAFAAEWRQGMYTLEALGVALAHAFGKGSGVDYPDAPLFSSEKMREMAEEQREKREMERVRAMLQAKMAAYNKRFEGQQGEKAAT